MEVLEPRLSFAKTELGLIPEDWILCEFQDVMTGFSSGQTPYREIKRYYTGDVPWITSGELNYNTVTETIEKITTEAVKKTNLKIIPKGTFLFAITGLEAAGTRGSCAVTGVDAATNQSCMALYPIPGKLITPYLFHFYVKNGDVLAFRYCQGTKQQSYTAEIAKKLPIVLPPTIEEQAAIAEALSDMDALIHQTEKLIEKKKALKQSVMQELLQPKKGWSYMRYGEIFDFLQNASYARTQLSEYGRVQYVHYGDIHTRFSDFLDVNEQDLPFVALNLPTNFSFVKHGDLIMADASEDYDGVGKSVEVFNFCKKPVIAGLHTVLLRDRNKVFIDGFKGYLHSISTVRKQFLTLATGTKVYGLTKNALSQVVAPIPPIEQQKQITSILSGLDSEIRVLEKKTKKLHLQKKSMMQALLTGKIRLV